MNIPQPLPSEMEVALQTAGGPLEIVGSHGRYVVMRRDVYDAMLGVSDDDEAETLASVRRGIADVDAGRTLAAAEVFDRLTARYGS